VPKLVAVAALVAVVAGRPRADNPPKYGAPPPKYPAAQKAYKEPEYAPQPFAYEYGVKDQYTGSSFAKAETQDDYGNVQGSYTVDLPDGRVQRVTYTAAEGGFVAEVTYEGTAVYPEEPAGGYGAYKGPGAFKPPQAAYAPKAAYAPAPKAYAPAPKAYAPAPKAYAPAPKAYAPAPKAYAPAPKAYAPEPIVPKYQS